MGKTRNSRRRAPKRRRIEAAARGNRSTIDSLTDEPESPSNHPVRGRRRRGHLEQDQAEEEEEQQQQKQGYDAKQSLPNLAAHFAALTKAVLNRITDGETSDRMYDEFIRRAKRTLIDDLKETYNELYMFYNDPSMPMPTWLSKSPPAKTFYCYRMDVRLEGRTSQVQKDLRAFLQEQGFVSSYVQYVTHGLFATDLRLDVSTVPTTQAREHVNKRLLTLDSVFNV